MVKVLVGTLNTIEQLCLVEEKEFPDNVNGLMLSLNMPTPANGRADGFTFMGTDANYNGFYFSRDYQTIAVWSMDADGNSIDVQYGLQKLQKALTNYKLLQLAGYATFTIHNLLAENKRNGLLPLSDNSKQKYDQILIKQWPILLGITQPK